MKIQRFEDLVGWQKARELNTEIYRCTNSGAFAKDYGLRDQIRRASISISSNIAEGFDRASRAEFHHFVAIAKGSCAEVQSQLYLALDVGYLARCEFECLMDKAKEVARLLGGLRKSLQSEGKMSDEKRMDSDKQRGPSNEQRATGSQSSDLGPQFCPYPQSSALSPQSCSPQDDEIDLLDLWRTIWRGKWLIIGVSFVAALLSAWYSLTLPNIYRAEVVVAPVEEQGGGQMTLSGLGGLASMAGISLGRSGNVDIDLAILRSREFLLKFARENNLKQILFEEAWDANSKSWRDKEPTDWAVYRMLNGMLSVYSNKKTGTISIAIEWTDAGLAARWANILIERLNAHLRQEALERSKRTLEYLNEELGRVRVTDMRQALYDLISQEQKKAMLASTQKEFAFRVLDAAVEPDRKVGPRRSLRVILAGMVAGFLTVLFALIREGMRRRKKAQEERA